MEQGSIKFILSVFVAASLLMTSTAWAQQQPAQATLPPNTTEQEAPRFGPRKQVATIIFAGLAGAVLGLSTLSFYGRPQEKLTNIAIGAAVGVISGTIYTTYKAATQPREFYGTDLMLDRLDYAFTANDLVLPIYSHTFSF